MGFSLRYFHGLFKRQTGLTPTQFAERCVELSNSTSCSVSTQAKSSETSTDLFSSDPNMDMQTLSASTQASTSCTSPTRRVSHETSAVILDPYLNLGIQAVPAFTRTGMAQENTSVSQDVLLCPDFGSLDLFNSSSQVVSAWFDFNQYYATSQMDNAENVK